MKISIATAPCSWGVFFPDGGISHTPYELFLKQVSEAGYVQIELGPDGYLPQDIELLKSKLKENHLAVCAGTATIPFGGMTEEQCKGVVDQLAKRLVSLDCKDMVVMDGSAYVKELGAKSDWSKETWDKIYSNILFINNYLRDTYGVRMVFHAHAGTAIEYTDEIEKMLAMGDINLCFDTGHHAYSNGGTQKPDRCALDFIKAHKDRIAYLHFKNVDGKVRQATIDNKWGIMESFKHQVMCDLEDGIIDFEELRDVLKEINFNGSAIIEQDMFNPSNEVAFNTAKRNLQYLKRIGMID